MAKFDYGAPADLYPARSGIGQRPFSYRRFETAAQAIRFVIEDMPAKFLNGTILEVDNERVRGEDIRALYGNVEYPLARKLKVG